MKYAPPGPDRRVRGVREGGVLATMGQPVAVVAVRPSDPPGRPC